MPKHAPTSTDYPAAATTGSYFFSQLFLLKSPARSQLFSRMEWNFLLLCQFMNVGGCQICKVMSHVLAAGFHFFAHIHVGWVSAKVKCEYAAKNNRRRSSFWRSLSNCCCPCMGYICCFLANMLSLWYVGCLPKWGVNPSKPCSREHRRQENISKTTNCQKHMLHTIIAFYEHRKVL